MINPNDAAPHPVVTLSREGTVAVVTIDNPPVNALSRAVRVGLLSALAKAEADPALTGGVLCCAGRTFVAGADITEMDQPPSDPLLPAVVDAFERSRLFWAASLHGNALGGGLELALACKARVAKTGTRLGMPEVTLGIIPGAGGTVRLTKLVGAERACRLAATGKPVDAEEARRSGLVDAVGEDAFGIALKLSMAADLPVRAPPPLPDPSFWEKEIERIRAGARGQHAPLEAFAAIRDAATLSRAEAMKRERERFLRLRQSDQARALRYLFFAERAAGASLRALPRVPDLARAGIVGGGTMGAGIATALLLSGIGVTLVERDDVAADRALDSVRANLKASAARGLINDVDSILSALAVTTAFRDLAPCALVVEAVFEDMSAKVDVFRELDAVMPPTAILATNTSYLDVGEIARSSCHPERVLGLHFFAPAHIMKLIEIVRTPQTGDEALALGAALARQLRKVAVASGVCDGFIGNRIMAAYRKQAEALLLAGALPEDVDTAMRDYGFAAGIFETQDLSGLDIAWAMRKRRRLEGKEPAARSIGDALCEAGRLGRKSEGGWYDYRNGRRETSPATAGIIADFRKAAGVAPRSFVPQEIMDAILSTMIREAETVLREGIAESREDIDVVMVAGFGFPRHRGGPMYIASRR